MKLHKTQIDVIYDQNGFKVIGLVCSEQVVKDLLEFFTPEAVQKHLTACNVVNLNRVTGKSWKASKRSLSFFTDDGEEMSVESAKRLIVEGTK